MINCVWAESSQLPEFPQLEHSTKTDVLIIGGGMAGLLCAHAMAQQGTDYLLIEADRICDGVSRNTTAKITSQHGLIYDRIIRSYDKEAAAMYFHANQEALARFRQLAETIPCDFETKDAFVYSIDDKLKIEKELIALEQIGVSAEYSDATALPFPVAGAVKFTEQAQFNPLKFAAGIAKGLNIREHTAAKTFDGRLVITDCGKIQADKIIVATHFPIFNKHGGYFLKMYQHRSYVIGLENGPQIDGMYVDEAENGLSFRNYGDLLLLGGGDHRTGKQGGNWAELKEFAKSYYPETKLKYRWAAQDCMSLDGIPYIGQYSKNTPDLYIASGFNKWGMSSSMVAAMVLSEMARGRIHPYADVFCPSRSMFHPQLFANLYEATASLLTVSKPRCPHMGCALKWNPHERSWDCPCHGSRFAEDGTLLDNPATGNTKTK